MSFLESFTNVAIMLIYPNGMVDKLFIDDENVLHMKYFRKLSNTSTYFLSLFKQSADGIYYLKSQP